MTEAAIDLIHLDQRYDVLGEKISGAVSYVVPLFDRQTGKMLAAKPIYQDEIGNLDFHEAKILQNLNPHPHIVDFLGYGEDAEGTQYFLMEFIEGSTLDIWNQREHEPNEIIEVVKQIMDTTAYVSSKYILSDLKPDNILVDNNNQVKFIDFLLAGKEGNKPKVRKDRKVIASSGYSPSERWNWEPRRKQDDVFSLGAVLYNLFTGEESGRDKSTMDIRQDFVRGRYSIILRPELELIFKGKPGLRQKLSLALRKALNPFFDSRTGSIEIFNQEINSILNRLDI